MTKTDAHTKAYHEPRYDTISEVATEEVNEVSYNKGKKQNTYDKSHNSSNFRSQYNRNQYSSHSNQAPVKVKCYYCDGKYHINECEKLMKGKVRYNLNRADIARKYKDRIQKNARKSNISINEVALSSKSQNSTYSIEQAEQLIRAVQLSKTNSDSK